MKVRVVKTASKARAVQVMPYGNNKRRILHHLGSAHSDEELNNLMMLAEEWIKIIFTAQEGTSKEKCRDKAGLPESGFHFYGGPVFVRGILQNCKMNLHIKNSLIATCY